MSICIHKCINIYIHAYIHIYTYMDIYTHVYAYIYISKVADTEELDEVIKELNEYMYT
jgi:hypothetical protein